jgi:hypothetical protein
VCTDATILDAGALLEIESGALYNVSKLLRFNPDSLFVSHAVMKDGCKNLDNTLIAHNYMAVCVCVWGCDASWGSVSLRVTHMVGVGAGCRCAC